MSHSLPGFDLWLARQPIEDEISPELRHYDEARKRLNEDGEDLPTDDEVDELAQQLAEEEAERNERDAEEAEAESRRDDREEVGDGP